MTNEKAGPPVGMSSRSSRFEPDVISRGKAGRTGAHPTAQMPNARLLTGLSFSAPDGDLCDRNVTS
jgi:hypothetical protein